ncbi:MAG: hypothetical protein IT175_12270 [Acidobacteria bacterium]|nr:hypothetical protein [Acidobacteriota bacterium]
MRLFNPPELTSRRDRRVAVFCLEDSANVTAVVSLRSRKVTARMRVRTSTVDDQLLEARLEIVVVLNARYDTPLGQPRFDWLFDLRGPDGLAQHGTTRWLP